jgi:hypothetical protein
MHVPRQSVRRRDVRKQILPATGMPFFAMCSLCEWMFGRAVTP